MMFKRKYKRSQWFEGLLWAEHCMGKYGTQENMFVEDTDGMEGYNILWRNCSHEKPWIMHSCNKEFGSGVLDYLYNKFINKS